MSENINKVSSCEYKPSTNLTSSSHWVTVSKVAWLNRSNIIFAGQDKWSLDPRVDLVTKGQLEYSLRIQKVDVYDEGSYTCSIQTKQQPKTSQVYLIVQVPANIYKVSEDITVNEGSNVTLSCLASGRPDPTITWRLLNPSGKSHPVSTNYCVCQSKGINMSQSSYMKCAFSPFIHFTNHSFFEPHISLFQPWHLPLDLDQSPLIECEGSRQFNTFLYRPCPL
uniref:Ig-like domain-containing protein n=1 Tax=Seriola lalandi dorsalis TaxID=1841481 RepID=A0A3B4WC98_SERLL